MRELRLQGCITPPIENGVVKAKRKLEGLIGAPVYLEPEERGLGNVKAAHLIFFDPFVNGSLLSVAAEAAQVFDRERYANRGMDKLQRNTIVREVKRGAQGRMARTKTADSLL